MANFGIEKNPKFVAVDYVANYPYEETEALVAKKLVKVLVSDDENVKVSQKPVEEVVEEVIVAEETAEPVKQRKPRWKATGKETAKKTKKLQEKKAAKTAKIVRVSLFTSEPNHLSKSSWSASALPIDTKSLVSMVLIL